ncbi:MAG: nicotinate-nucleotide adenylyltransferase [Chloroflexi bacterium]|nr:nicotinate-nucleotide adenylyltransferase [Chloroflexota bacterium]
MTKSKIGVLGGTFDPIHLGHLIVAEDIRQKLGLGEVLFVPAGRPWLKLKEEKPISAAEHRLDMVRLAVASNPYFKVSTLEIDRPGLSYSIDTILELKAKLGAGAEIYFIVGPDALAELPRWKDPGRLIEICQVVGIGRPGHTQTESHILESSIPGVSQRIMLVDVPQIDISATEIRKRVAQGLSIRYLVPEAVEKYIAEHKLYL